MANEAAAAPSAEEIKRVRQYLAERECKRYGHDFEQVVVVSSLDPTHLLCARCGRQWPIGPGSGGAG